MDRKALAHLLEEAAVYLELSGANPFKARAFQNAGRIILRAGLDDDQLRDPAVLRTVKGIGPSLAEAIAEAAAGGRLAALEELKASVDPGLIELTRVPGLGVKKALALHRHLGVSSLGELAYAVNENRLAALPGFGAKTQARIAQGLDFLKRHQDQFLYPEALAVARDLEAHFAGRPEAAGLTLVGALRRRLEVVDRVEVLLASSAPQSVLTHFSTWVKGTPLSLGPANRASIRHPAGPPVAVEVVEPASFPAALIRTTGSAEHVEGLKRLAGRQGLDLKEDGLYQGDRRLDLADEAAIYGRLSLEPVPPELREGLDELELAARGRLPRPIEPGQIRGLFHVHTNRSDGGYSLLEMAAAAQELGYEYLGLSDHSRSAAYAGGLKTEELLAQAEEVARVNAELSPFRVFHGVESEVLADGSLDYPAEILDRLDFVIASIHSRFSLSRPEQTARVLRALADPATTILGHPTGRLLLARQAYELDMEAVIEACAERGVVMEINCHPLRLDTDWRVARLARTRGVRFCLSPDAHSREGLGDVVYGLGAATKAGLEAGDVINCLGADELAAHLAWVKESR